MRTLALDTTTRAGSVALLADDRLVEERIGDPSRTHAERLPEEISALAAAHGLAVGDADLFAVAAGPGSFTGLRIGIATMQGLALVAQRPIVAVPALEALGALASGLVPAGTIVAAWMDAHRRDVFSALYRTTAEPGGSASLVEVEDAMVGDPESTLARWRRSGTEPMLFIGDGATLYADVIARECGSARVAGAPPLAAAIGRLGMARARQGSAGHPASVQPLYVRRPDAEIDRERKHARGRGSD